MVIARLVLLLLLLAVGALNGARGGRITPYKAVIEYKGSAFCVGTVIDTVWILTAASCVMNHTVSYITVRLGSSGNGHPYTTGGVLNSVRAFFIHPKYDPESSQRDIALLRLGATIKFSATIAAIPLVKPGYGMEEGTRCTIPSPLQDVKAKLWSREKCEAIHPLSPELTDDALCAKIVPASSNHSHVVGGSKPINHQQKGQLWQARCSDHHQHHHHHKHEQQQQQHQHGQHPQSRFVLGSPLVCEGKQVALVSHSSTTKFDAVSVAAAASAATPGHCNQTASAGRDLPDVFTDVAFADQWISSHTTVRRKRRPGSGKRRPSANIRRKLHSRNRAGWYQNATTRVVLLIGLVIGLIARGSF